MEKEKFFSGLWIIIGLIFGSVFTNFVYQDYLAYGGTVRSLVLNNTDLYKASISLFFYILFKRGKQYAFIYLGAYLLHEFISTFYLLCDHLAAADQAKLLCPKKRRNAL